MLTSKSSRTPSASYAGKRPYRSRRLAAVDKPDSVHALPVDSAGVSQSNAVAGQAANSQNAEMLHYLSIVAENFSRNGAPLTAVPADSGDTGGYDAYVWHDANDNWCFRIAALRIEERNHVSPAAMEEYAIAAAALAKGAPVAITIVLGPSTGTSGHAVKNGQAPDAAAPDPKVRALRLVAE